MLSVLQAFNVENPWGGWCYRVLVVSLKKMSLGKNVGHRFSDFSSAVKHRSMRQLCQSETVRRERRGQRERGSEKGELVAKILGNGWEERERSGEEIKDKELQEREEWKKEERK